MQFEEKHPTPRPAKIQNVQKFLRDRAKFAKHYKPKLVSFGPIHYKPKQLQLGEQYKKMWAAAHVESSQENDEKLYEKIKNNIAELKELYTKDAITGKCNQELAWMLFVDGCAVLYFLKNADIDHPEKLKIKIDQMLLVQQDLLLLENQLPYRLLELLTHDPCQLKKSMEDFCQMHELVAPWHC